MVPIITAVKGFKIFVVIFISGGEGGKIGDQCLILMYMLPIPHNIKIRAIHAYLPEIWHFRSQPDSPLKGGKESQASKTSPITWGFWGGRCKPPQEKFLILGYFMCFLKPHEQVISIKIIYSPLEILGAS